LVLLHSSSFVILSVHFIFIIHLEHLLINVCNLLVIWWDQYTVPKFH
jgi:hypothetical protein